MRLTTKSIYNGFLLGGILLCIVLFWKCPLQEMFGIPCPGCNMTTSLYYLCKGEIGLSLFYHPLGIVLVICMLVEGVYYLRYKRIHKGIFYGFIVLLGVVYVYRMITIFPQIPMVYVEDNLVSKVKALFF